MDHLCCYFRRACPQELLNALDELGLPVEIFGLGARAPSGNLTFSPVDELGFVRSLATCRALVCTAGNQLVGEAMWLDKPVLAMPEPGNNEQRINAHFVVASGAGTSVPLDDATSADLRAFMDRIEDYRAAIDKDAPRRKPTRTIDAIERHLPARSTSPRPRQPATRSPIPFTAEATTAAVRS